MHVGFQINNPYGFSFVSDRTGQNEPLVLKSVSFRERRRE